MLLKNKKFVISAAGDGIGFAISKLIIKNGGIVYLSDIDQKKINKIQKNKKFKNKIFATQLDANHHKAVKEYISKLKIKKIDGLINNVGIAGPTKYIEKISIDEWKSTIETNLTSHFYFTKYLIPLLKKNKSGSIVVMDIFTGEIVAMHSSPSFDPNLFFHGISNKDWNRSIKNKYYLSGYTTT